MIYDDGARNDPKRYKDLGVEIYSFDRAQSIKDNLLFKHYYYGAAPLVKVDNNKQILQDIYFIGVDKGRLQLLKKLAKDFSQMGLSFKCQVVRDRHRRYQKADEPFLSVPQKYEQIVQNIKQSIAVLDINASGQSGITLRPMEAMFFNKKLITNNRDVLKYDFYCSDNVFIIGVDELARLKEFLLSPVVPVPDSVKKKYSAEAWLEGFFA